MSKDEIERESRNGRLAGIAGLLGVILYASSFAIAPDFNSAERAEKLQTFDAASGDFLLQTIVQALALILFAPVLVGFFRAVQARNETVRPGLIGLAMICTVLLAGSTVAAYVGYDAASDAFLATDAGVDVESNDDADDVYFEQTATQLYTGLGFAGSFALVFVTIYTSLFAMRAGMMTRFVGTLAMALGAGTLLFGLPMLLVFIVLISLLMARFWPGTLPPAWDAGEAIPWLRPGETAASTGPEEDELARPEDFEGTATEVNEEPDERPGRRDNKRKRKRKQRG